MPRQLHHSRQSVEKLEMFKPWRLQHYLSHNPYHHSSLHVKSHFFFDACTINMIFSTTHSCSRARWTVSVRDTGTPQIITSYLPESSAHQRGSTEGYASRSGLNPFLGDRQQQIPSLSAAKRLIDFRARKTDLCGSDRFPHYRSSNRQRRWQLGQ